MLTGTRLRGRPVKERAEVNEAYEDLRALTDELAEKLEAVNGAALRMAVAAGYPHLHPEEAA